MISLVNQQRAAAQCPAVRPSPVLTQVAQAHSVWQTTHGMSHEGAGGSQVSDRVSAAGYQWSRVGENVAYGYPSAAEVMQAWMASPGHKANILTCDFTQIGVGVAADPRGRLYWTQVFATPR